MKKIIIIAVAILGMIIMGIIGANAVSAAGWTPLRHGLGYNITYRGVQAGACRVELSAPYKIKVLVVRSDTSALRSNIKYQTFDGDESSRGETPPISTWAYYSTLQLHEVNNMISGDVSARVRFSNNELASWYMIDAAGFDLSPHQLEVCP